MSPTTSLSCSFELTDIPLDPVFGTLIVLELLLIRTEFGGVVVAAAVVIVLGRVKHVEHLVINDVLHDEAGNIARVERAADGDVVMSGVVMAEDTIGFGR